jgi:hypothetical protein
LRGEEAAKEMNKILQKAPQEFLEAFSFNQETGEFQIDDSKVSTENQVEFKKIADEFKEWRNLAWSSQDALEDLYD